MNTKIPLGLSLLVMMALGVASPIKADPILTYNHVDAAYQWTHYDDSAASDSNGLTSGVTFSPIESFFLELGYDYQSSKIKYTDTSLDGNFYKYGLGGYYALDREMHLVGHLGGVHANVDVESGSGVEDVSDDGFYAVAELRYAFCKEGELDPFLGYDSVADTDTWTYGVNGVYALNDSWGLTAGVDLNNDSDLNLRAGARWSFDTGSK